VDDNFLVQTLDSWPRLSRLLLALTIILLIVAGAVILVLKFLPTQVGELQFSIGDSHVALKQATKTEKPRWLWCPHKAGTKPEFR
jgi:hypothetical protein